jgi:hypothetical protein
VIGREREIAVVSALLDSEPRGPRALLVDGEAGIGKSTVWFEAVRLAEVRGYRVLRARPAESEAKLSYATLADVAGPARLSASSWDRFRSHRCITSCANASALRRRAP